MARRMAVPENMFDSFVDDLAAQTGHVDLENRPANTGEFAQRFKIMLDRGLFTFERHDYLRVPYQDEHPAQVEMKSAQMGNTTRAFLRMFCNAMYSSFVGVLYLFASAKGVGDFSRSRITPFLKANPDTIGRWLKDTDSVGLKRFFKCNLIFRGTRSTEGLRSDPVDQVIYDEYDLMPRGVEDSADERMSHSDHKVKHFLSNPTIPDFGIDKKFQQSDQRWWLIKCSGCNQWNNLVKDFPDCLHVTNDGSVIRACRKCGRELDPMAGQWVAEFPSVTEWRGYQYSQLFSSYVPPGEILRKFNTADDIGAVWNYKIGLPYIEAENRLSKEEVLALCGTAGIASADRGPCTMGVDQGPRDLHVQIGKRHPDRVIHLATYPEWEDLDRMMKIFNISCCVVDAQPEVRNARAFAKRWPGKVWLCYYSEPQKGSYLYNEQHMTVTVNRTESLDQSHTELQGGHIGLPKRCDVTEEYAAHCHNIAKKREEDEETGEVKYFYVKLGPDHYRHAANYEKIARDRVSGSYFGDCDTAGEGDEAKMDQPLKKGSMLTRALQYIRNAGKGATLEAFIEDHEPVGEQLWEELLEAELVELDGERIRLSTFGEEVCDEQ